MNTYASVATPENTDTGKCTFLSLSLNDRPHWLTPSGIGDWAAIVGTWSELYRRLRMSPRAIAVVIGLSDWALIADQIQQLRYDFESVPIVAVGHFDGNDAQHLIELGRLGVVAALDLHRYTSGDEIRRAITAIVSDAVTTSFLLAAGVTNDVQLCSLLRAFLDDPRSFRTIDEFAKGLGRHPKTLRRRLRMIGLPSPERLTTWMRLFVASTLLQDRARSARAVAHACGFRSEASLRATVRRYLAHGLSDMRSPQAMGRIRDAVAKECGTAS